MIIDLYTYMFFYARKSTYTRVPKLYNTEYVAFRETVSSKRALFDGYARSKIILNARASLHT